MNLPAAEPRCYDDAVPASLQAVMQRELERLGCTVAMLGPFTYATWRGKPFLLHESATSFTSTTAYRLLSNKHLTSLLLRHHGLSVLNHTLFTRDDKVKALAAVQALGRAVVKPVNLNKGRGLTLEVTAENFEEAWRFALAEASSGILVESYFEGHDARYLVIDGRCEAVFRRIPPVVRGDGTSSIAELVDQRNARRLRNPHLIRYRTEIDDRRRQFIRRQGFEMSAVPAKGQTVLLDMKVGPSAGGDAMDITDHVHPVMKRIAERTSQMLPGLDVIGIDIMSKDHAAYTAPSDYAILEVNTRPALGGHHYRSYGEPRNVSRKVAESCIAKLQSAFPFNQTGANPGKG